MFTRPARILSAGPAFFCPSVVAMPRAGSCGCRHRHWQAVHAWGRGSEVPACTTTLPLNCSKDAVFSLDLAAKQLRRLIAALDKMKLETPSREVGDSTRPSSQAHQPGNRVETSSPPEFAGDAAAPSAPKTMETSTAAASAKRLREFWHGVSLGSEMNVGSLTIDLRSPEGRGSSCSSPSCEAPGARAGGGGNVCRHSRKRTF